MRKLLATLPYARNLISHRCPELSDADLALITQPAEPSAEMLPVEIGRDIMTVLAAMEAKLDWLG
jgi:hypothetical protein